MKHSAIHKLSKTQPSLLSKVSDRLCCGDMNSAVYFYHSDHLGSASWITNGSGTPVQHLQYMPYGEPFVNERTTGYEERFTFTGKERDSETGFSYFGARYYDSDILTGWLSVDPMADKYPSLSPYAYCAWNPVRLVDPDGKENLSALKWARENLSNKGIPFGPGFNDAKGWNYSRGSIPNELYCYDACFVAYMNSDENIVKFLMNTGFSTPNGTFFGRCKYPGGIDWFKNGNGKDRTFETDISKGELGDIIFMGDCVGMNGHTALLNAPPQFGTYINEDGTTIETVTLHTLSTQSDSDPDNFGEKEYTFAKQRNGTWKLDGGTNLVFRGYGQIKSIPNENQ